MEYVVFVFSQFSAVDFIEDLHKDKGVEDKSVVLNLKVVHHLNTINSVVESLVVIIIITEDSLASE